MTDPTENKLDELINEILFMIYESSRNIEDYFAGVVAFTSKIGIKSFDVAKRRDKENDALK